MIPRYCPIETHHCFQLYIQRRTHLNLLSVCRLVSCLHKGGHLIHDYFKYKGNKFLFPCCPYSYLSLQNFLVSCSFWKYLFGLLCARSNAKCHVRYGFLFASPLLIAGLFIHSANIYWVNFVCQVLQLQLCISNHPFHQQIHTECQLCIRHYAWQVQCLILELYRWAKFSILCFLEFIL